jgi:oxalate---CoA ligase
MDRVGATRARRALSPPGRDLRQLVRRRAMEAPDRSYVESATGARTVAYGELWAASERWGALLDDLATPAGATVGLAVSDPIDFAMAFAGVIAGGRTVAPLDPGSTDAELSAVCGRTAPALVVSDRAAPALPAPEWVTMPAGTFALPGTCPERSVGSPSRDAEGPYGGASGASGASGEHGGSGGVVLSTSGTTGVPKVIRIGQRALLNTAEAVAAHHELAPDDRGYNPLPLFHINAEVVGLLATLVSGSTLVLDDRFHRQGFWDRLTRRQVTWINAVPAILGRVSALADDERVPGGIRFARSASAPLPPAVLERFERVTGIAVLETYGMTEAASQITANPLRGPRKRGSVGCPVGTELRIAATEGADPPVGRVAIRGASVIRAYASPGYEDRFDADGWLDTGDLGYLDEDGYLFLVGRADDVINRGGEKIYPREVEDAILGEPGVVSVAVVGREDPVLGQVPVAYLVAEGVRGAADFRAAEALAARVRDRCADALSRAKRPVSLHVVDRLPQGATGKVRREAVSAGAGGSAICSLPVT